MDRPLLRPGEFCGYEFPNELGRTAARIAKVPGLIEVSRALAELLDRTETQD